MKTFLISLLMFTAWAANAARAVDEYVTLTGSGSTAATVFFEPGPRDAQLVVADVTSDKAASVLNWRVGGSPMTILKAVPATVTSNILCTTTPAGTYGLLSNIVSVTAAGVVTAHTAGTNSLVTNGVVSFRTPLGTNIVVNDRLREMSTVYWDVTGTSSTNVIWVSTNIALTNATLYLFWASPSQAATNTLTSYTTNGTDYRLNFTNNFSFTPTRIYAITTNLYTATLASDASSRQVTLDTIAGLSQDDWLIMTPTNGGTFLRQLEADPVSLIYQNQTISAATGIALAAGDRLFVLGPNIQTPVGAATVRLTGNPLRVIPVGMPARLTVDGTSAVTINAAVVKY